VTTISNSLVMLLAISRKDYRAQTRNNTGYVTGELSSLLQNDTWSVHDIATQ
jgi:hypothetical protein